MRKDRGIYSPKYQKLKFIKFQEKNHLYKQKRNVKSISQQQTHRYKE